MSGHRMAPLFSWRSAICDSDLSPTQRHVALTLSLHMNERGGSCFPSVGTLMSETGLAERTVREALKMLSETGWLVKKERATGSGRQTSNEYQALVPGGEGAGDAPTGVQEVQGEGLTDAPPEGVLEGDSKRANPPNPPRGEDDAWTRAFDLFWQEYPRKVGKPAAFRAFKSALKKNSSTGQMTAIAVGLQNWVEFWADDGTDERHIPHPSTWLNQERWNDRPPAPNPKKPDTMDLLARAARGELR